MDNNIVKSNALMKTAVILRLVGNAAIAVFWAQSYSDGGEMLLRVYNGGLRTAVVISCLLLDTALTLMWQRYKQAYSAHLALYVWLGLIFYIFVQIDALNVYEGGIGSIMFLFIGVIMMVVGAVPFMLFDIGRKKVDDRVE